MGWFVPAALVPAVLVGLVALFGLGCGEVTKGVTVEVVAPLSPGVEFQYVETRISEGVNRSGEVLHTIHLAAYANHGFGVGFPVAHIDHLTRGQYTVCTRLLDARYKLLHERCAVATVVDDAVVRLHFTRECETVLCASNQDQLADQCVKGLCVDPRCDPHGLPESSYCAPLAEVGCTSDSECSSDVACAPGLCVDGMCMAQPDDNLCGETEYCHSSKGCTTLPALLSEGPEVDPSCGTLCKIPGSCAHGFWSCVGDSKECVGLVPLPERTSCGSGGLCTRGAECVQCIVGQDCSNGGNECLVASCSANACLTTPVAEGTPCGGGSCDGSGQCIPVLYADQTMTAGTFGYSVAVDNDIMVVGAPGENSSFGAAYVFEKTNGAWGQVAHLTPGTVQTMYRFGFAVDVEGQTIVVGADSTSNALDGAVHVFERQGGGAWVETQVVKSNDIHPNDSFGFSVSLNGERLAVGATNEVQMAGSVGAAYVFQRNGSGVWTQDQKLTEAGLQIAARYGYSVDLDGDRLAVGAYAADTAHTDAGKVFVYEKGTVWNRTATLTGSASSGYDYFGVSLDLEGDRLVVGSTREIGQSNPASRAGSVYLFALGSGTGWQETHRLQASDGTGSNLFGRSVRLVGDQLVVGAAFQDSEGAVYVFDLGGSTPVQTTKQTAVGSQPNYYLGWSLDVADSEMMVGAIGDTSGGSYVGATHVFQMP